MQQSRRQVSQATTSTGTPTPGTTSAGTPTATPKTIDVAVPTPSTMQGLRDTLKITAYEDALKQVLEALNGNKEVSDTIRQALGQAKNDLWREAQNYLGGEGAPEYKRFKVIIQSYEEALKKAKEEKYSGESARNLKTLRDAVQRQQDKLIKAAALKYNIDVSMGVKAGLGWERFKNYTKNKTAQFWSGLKVGGVIAAGMLLAGVFGVAALPAGLLFLAAAAALVLAPALLILTMYIVRGAMALANAVKKNPYMALSIGISMALAVTFALVPALIVAATLGATYLVANKLSNEGLKNWLAEMYKNHPKRTLVAVGVAMVALAYLLWLVAPVLFGTAMTTTILGGIASVLGAALGWMASTLVATALSGYVATVGAALSSVGISSAALSTGAAFLATAGVFLLANPIGIVLLVGLSLLAVTLAYFLVSDANRSRQAHQKSDQQYNNVLKLADDAVRDKSKTIDLAKLNAPASNPQQQKSLKSLSSLADDDDSFGNSQSLLDSASVLKKSPETSASTSKAPTVKIDTTTSSNESVMARAFLLEHVRLGTSAYDALTDWNNQKMDMGILRRYVENVATSSALRDSQLQPLAEEMNSKLIELDIGLGEQSAPEIKREKTKSKPRSFASRVQDGMEGDFDFEEAEEPPLTSPLSSASSSTTALLRGPLMSRSTGATSEEAVVSSPVSVSRLPTFANPRLPQLESLPAAVTSALPVLSDADVTTLTFGSSGAKS